MKNLKRSECFDFATGSFVLREKKKINLPDRFHDNNIYIYIITQ